MTDLNTQSPQPKQANVSGKGDVRRFALGVALLTVLIWGFFATLTQPVSAAPLMQVDTDTPTPTETPTVTDTPSITDTPTNTSTPTVTSTFTLTTTLTSTITVPFTITPTVRTSTPTRTPSKTATPTITPTAPRRIIFSEVAWAGTTASSSDEWVEFYNPGPAVVDLSGWKLLIVGNGPSTTITLLSGTLRAGKYYLLEHDEDTTNIPSNQTASNLSLLDSGNILLLYDSAGRQVDTANFDNGAWPAGSSSPKCSMERVSAYVADIGGWYTNDNTIHIAKDQGGNNICGSPKSSILSATLTPTKTGTKTSTPTRARTSTRTRTPTKTRTPTPAPLAVSSVVINEFLSQPRFDWNGDGTVDSGDAFIEIKNLSPVSVSVTGWVLDDQPGDSSSYTLPSLTLEAGGRAVYFASETHIVLSNAGDSVRLFHGQFISDVYTYNVIKVPNQSWCRLPDGGPKWVFGCEPTPKLENKLAQSVFVNDQPISAVCLSKTTLLVVYEAECASPGLSIWSPGYWLGELQREYPLYLERDGQVDIIE